MTDMTTLEAFHSIIEQLAVMLLEAVNAEAKDGWVAARFYTRGNFHKLRVERPDGSIHGFHPPVEIDELLFQIWDYKDQAFEKKWHGLRLTVYPNGKCEIDFSYEENDPGFFDS
jgi:hypothetical protein